VGVRVWAACLPAGSIAVVSDPLLQMRGIDKWFPGVHALNHVDFSVRPGEVHALIGGNGAGKSTLLKVLTGVLRADGGSITFEGTPLVCGSPAEAVRCGISTIYQEVNLVRTLSVAENLLLGRAPRAWYGLSWRRMRMRAVELLGGLGIDIDVSRPLGSYPVGVQQMVCVARAVDTDARLIVMDEPTSSLDARETRRFFALLEQLRARGLSVIFVTHFLDQVYRISDRITILRNGRQVGVFEAAALPRTHLVAHMLGRSPAEVEAAAGATAAASAVAPERPAAEHATTLGGATPVLSVHDLGRCGTLAPVSLAARAGEVLGFAGLLGSGRTELARLVFGADRADSGVFEVDGRRVKIKGPRRAILLGLAMAPEDRQADGLVQDLSVRENIVLALQAAGRRGAAGGRTGSENAGCGDAGGRGGGFGWGARARQRSLARRFVEQLGIVCADLDQPVRNLSGGNQQKVILARWLACRPRVLILDEPTRGIDVGAKAEIERLVRELCRAGLAVIFISAELDEVARLSDRVLVLRDRRAVGTLERSRISEEAIMAAIAGKGGQEPFQQP